MAVSREHIEKCKKEILYIIEENLPKRGKYSTNFLKLKDLIAANNFTISTSLKELQEEGRVVARIKEADGKELEYFATKNIAPKVGGEVEKFHQGLKKEIEQSSEGLETYGNPRISIKYPPYSLSTYLAWRTFLRNKKTDTAKTGWALIDEKKIWERIKAEKTSSDEKITLAIEVLNARMPTEERKSRYKGEYDKFTIEGTFRKDPQEIERIPSVIFNDYLDSIIKSFETLVERTQVLDSYARVIAGYSKWDYDKASSILEELKEFPALNEEYEEIIGPMHKNFFVQKFSKLNKKNKERLSECFMYMDMRIQEEIEGATKYMQAKNV